MVREELEDRFVSPSAAQPIDAEAPRSADEPAAIEAKEAPAPEEATPAMEAEAGHANEATLEADAAPAIDEAVATDAVIEVSAVPAIEVEAGLADDATLAACEAADCEDGEILVEEMTPFEALSETEIEHVDLAPPTISEIVLIGAREGEDEDENEEEQGLAIEEEPASLASLAALAAVGDRDGEKNPITISEASVAESSPSLAPPAPDDPFTVLVCRLSDVALSAGAPHVAAILPGLLFEGRLPESLEAEALNALRDGGLVVANEISPTFVSRTNAWREILRGTSDDFEAAGNVMLDEWAADVLARLLSAPQRATSLRQELRTRGVAAFGLVEAA